MSISIFGFIIARPVSAADLSTPKSWLPTIPSLLGSNSQLPTGDLTSATSQVLPFIVSALLYIVIILALVFLVIGGITWITSGGDKEALAKAKSTVTYAIIGLVLGLSSFLILSLLESFFQLGTLLLGQRSFIPHGTFRY